MKIDDVLKRLSYSKFRSSFHLNKKMNEYIDNKGFDVIKNHAFDFINQRLKTKHENDGKQTPMKGHPVFIAQHACACCCRSCLEKWHHIKQNKTLSEEEIEYIVNLLMKWIEIEYLKNN